MPGIEHRRTAPRDAGRAPRCLRGEPDEVTRDFERLVFGAQSFELETEDAACRRDRSRTAVSKQTTRGVAESRRQRTRDSPIRRRAHTIDELDEIRLELALIESFEERGCIAPLVGC